MRQVLKDIWETRPDNPFPGLTTHAYLWTPAQALFYSPATDAEFDELSDLGGVTHHYLSHRDEAGPMLNAVARQFGSTLHAPLAELDDIAKLHRSTSHSAAVTSTPTGSRSSPPPATPRAAPATSSRAPRVATCSPGTPSSAPRAATGGPATSRG